MATLNDLFSHSLDITEVLNQHQHYFAHIHTSGEVEMLADHTALVSHYARMLVFEHGLDTIVDSLVKGCINTTTDIRQKEFGITYLKKLFVNAIVFHDYGKLNENFQVDRMKNIYFSKNRHTILSPAHGHSFLGSYIFLIYHLNEIMEERIDDQDKSYLILYTYFFSHIINQHHGSMLECPTDRSFLSSFQGTYKELKKYLFELNINPDKNQKQIEFILNKINEIYNSLYIKEDVEVGNFPLYALIKLCYSLLTASDYLATHEYMNGTPTTDFGVLDDTLRKAELINHLRTFKHNTDTYSCLDGYKFVYPAEISNKNLNLLRREMTIELIGTIRNNKDKRLFYIEAPTGGGKTNLSMIALSELLEWGGDINKVFYVFPFTSLITQTYQVLKQSFGLKDDELVELHSKASLAGHAEKTNDGLYGDKIKNFIDSQFALYPFAVLSHVKFFDILKSNRKESNYLLHRLANSVVIIDELQSYHPKIWDMMLYFIHEYAQYFNIRFIIMSATLPKIGSLDLSLENCPDFVELIPNAKKYLCNPNFSKRVTFKFDLFGKKIDLFMLSRFLIDKSYCYKKQNSDSVYTIIEFIFKNTASKFYKILSDMDHPFDDIFVMSGTILESRRKEIINYIKNPSHRSRSILLITTQVVEAGVDIDMDLGFKNVSLIDSDEQLAGRVNRNANKQNAAVYLFSVNNASVLYKADYRYKITRENISEQDYKSILEKKDFSKLYDLVFSLIDKRNKSEYIRNFQSDFLQNGIYHLDFSSVNRKFKIIDQQNQTVFVPLTLPVVVASSQDSLPEERIFTDEELSFLEQFNVFAENGHLSGKEVWRVYETLICQRSEKFDLSEKVNFKIMQTILSKFTFSLLSNASDLNAILSGFGEEKYGYIYFSHWNEERHGGVPYDYISGLNAEAFNDIQFI